MHVLFRQGIHLPDLDLWLDPHHTRPSAFVTHAHADHMKRHCQVFATAPTAAMMRLRGATHSQFQTLEWGQKWEWEGAQVSLYPAGHVLGSAQTLVEHAGERLLYSGDFKLRASRSAEKIEVPQADIVVMETTFGRPKYRFPDSEAVLENIRDWCRETLDAGFAPVLLCYSLGKGQEVLAGLQGGDFPIYLQAAHFKMAQIYCDWGVCFPEYRLFEPGQKLDGPLLCAGPCRRSKWFCELQKIRTAYISGWALDGGGYRFGTDAAFPLSDHADYEDLLEYVRLTGAQTVYTLHGFEAEFAAALRERGLDARPLCEVGGEISTPGRGVRKVARPDNSQLALF